MLLARKHSVVLLFGVLLEAKNVLATYFYVIECNLHGIRERETSELRMNDDQPRIHGASHTKKVSFTVPGRAAFAFSLGSKSCSCLSHVNVVLDVTRTAALRGPDSMSVPDASRCSNTGWSG